MYLSGITRRGGVLLSWIFTFVSFLKTKKYHKSKLIRTYSDLNIFWYKNYSCHVTGVTCWVSHAICRMSVTRYTSLMPTATAIDPPPANSPSLHSRILILQKWGSKISLALSEQKLQFLRTMSFHFPKNFPKNFFVCN